MGPVPGAARGGSHCWFPSFAICSPSPSPHASVPRLPHVLPLPAGWGQGSQGPSSLRSGCRRRAVGSGCLSAWEPRGNAARSWGLLRRTAGGGRGSADCGHGAPQPSSAAAASMPAVLGLAPGRAEQGAVPRRRCPARGRFAGGACGQAARPRALGAVQREGCVPRAASAGPASGHRRPVPLVVSGFWCGGFRHFKALW